MEKIGDIIESIANEKNLEIKDVKETVQTAFINTAKRMFGENYEYDAVFNETSKKIDLFQKILKFQDYFLLTFLLNLGQIFHHLDTL